MAHGSVLLHALFVNALFLLISENAGENICGEGGDCFVIAVDIAVQQLFGGANVFAEVIAVFLRHEIGAGICEVGKALAEEAQLVQLFVFGQLCDLIDFRFVVQFCDIQRISQRAVQLFLLNADVGKSGFHALAQRFKLVALFYRYRDQFPKKNDGDENKSNYD